MCVPHWCWVVAPITRDFNGCKNSVSWPLMGVFALSRHAMWPFPPWTHLNFSVMIIQRLYRCSTLVLAGSTHYLGLYWLVKTLLSGLFMFDFALSHCAMWPFPPWTHLNFSVMIIQRLYWCSTLVLAGSTHYLGLYWLVKTLLSGLFMLDFSLSRHATWPFPPGTHLHFSVMSIQRQYLCSTLVLGGSTHYLGLWWL
jgi:uncharacterized membrane protein